MWFAEIVFNSSSYSVFGHVRPNCQTEADAGACKTDPIYMGMICQKSFCDGISCFAFSG